jgi:pimeloyl-ACP methyl ester carboxylesterase
MSAMDTLRGYAGTSTRSVTADNTIEYAYRDLGDGNVPLVLLQHFRGNLDNWDPALIDALAADRRVVTFDNVGVGTTTGSTPSTVEAMAHDAIAFLETMNFQKVDLLGFSLGSFVAQEIALIRPSCAAHSARILGTAGCGGDARLGTGGDRRGRSAGDEP